MERKGKGSPSTAMLKLCRPLILAFPDGMENFVAYHASHNRFGTIMMQKEKAIAHDSRQLKFQEKKYTTHDLELGDIKRSVAADALSRNEQAKPFRVRALVMTINSNLPTKIHKAQVESLKKDNVKDENLYGITTYVSKCLTCLKMRDDYQKPSGLLIISRVGTVAYRLEIPEQLSRVHSTFHVSKLKKCMAEEPLAIPLDEIQVDDKLNLIEEPVEIMDREVMRMK
nr:reverse transcriptase domain-containing protein [Tanacetum cinerariifolium]